MEHKCPQCGKDVNPMGRDSGGGIHPGAACYGVHRRSFAAATMPPGSLERDAANCSTATSEYYPSKPYLVIAPNLKMIFRTKREAEACFADVDGKF